MIMVGSLVNFLHNKNQTIKQDLSLHKSLQTVASLMSNPNKTMKIMKIHK